jgi:hypothetical protein
VGSTTEALLLFAERLSVFDESYRQAIQAATSLGRPTTVCTIYNGQFPDELRHAARVALMMFNDVIQTVAREFGVDVIELRNVCTEESDYANPIEPSGSGGRKIAHAIVHSVVPDLARSSPKGRRAAAARKPAPKRRGKGSRGRA